MAIPIQRQDNPEPDNIEDMDSDESEFFEIKLKPPFVEKLACFCEGGNNCPIHHADGDPD